MWHRCKDKSGSVIRALTDKERHRHYFETYSNSFKIELFRHHIFFRPGKRVAFSFPLKWRHLTDELLVWNRSFITDRQGFPQFAANRHRTSSRADLVICSIRWLVASSLTAIRIARSPMLEASRMKRPFSRRLETSSAAVPWESLLSMGMRLAELVRMYSVRVRRRLCNTWLERWVGGEIRRASHGAC